MATFYDFVCQTYQRYMAMDDAGDQRITNDFGAGMQARNEELRISNAAIAEVWPLVLLLTCLPSA